MSLNEERSYVTNCHCCCPHHGTKHSINNIFLHNTARHQHKQKPFFHDISERSYKYFLHLCPCTSLSPGSKTPARQHFLKQSLCGFVAADTTSTTSEITSHPARLSRHEPSKIFHQIKIFSPPGCQQAAATDDDHNNLETECHHDPATTFHSA